MYTAEIFVISTVYSDTRFLVHSNNNMIHNRQEFDTKIYCLILDRISNSVGIRSAEATVENMSKLNAMRRNWSC